MALLFRAARAAPRSGRGERADRGRRLGGRTQDLRTDPGDYRPRGRPGECGRCHRDARRRADPGPGAAGGSRASAGDGAAGGGRGPTRPSRGHACAGEVGSGRVHQTLRQRADRGTAGQTSPEQREDASGRRRGRAASGRGRASRPRAGARRARRGPCQPHGSPRRRAFYRHGCDADRRAGRGRHGRHADHHADRFEQGLSEGLHPRRSDWPRPRRPARARVPRFGADDAHRRGRDAHRPRGDDVHAGEHLLPRGAGWSTPGSSPRASSVSS